MLPDLFEIYENGIVVAAIDLGHSEFHYKKKLFSYLEALLKEEVSK